MATITHQITINAMLAQFAILYTISIKNNASTYQSGVILHNGGNDNNYDFFMCAQIIYFSYSESSSNLKVHMPSFAMGILLFVKYMYGRGDLQLLNQKLSPSQPTQKTIFIENSYDS